MAGDSVNHRDVQKPAHDTHSKPETVVDPLADYRPHSLNHAAYGAAALAPMDRSKCSTGPKLNDLTIDLTIHEKDTPNRGDSAAKQAETKKHDLPISNEHFQKIAKDGAEKLAQGTFSLPLRNALDEAHQTDLKQAEHKGNKTIDQGKHVKELLEYVNSQLCNSDTTLGRDGNTIKVIQTQYNNAKPEVGNYNLNTKDWSKTQPKDH